MGKIIQPSGQRPKPVRTTPAKRGGIVGRQAERSTASTTPTAQKVSLPPPAGMIEVPETPVEYRDTIHAQTIPVAQLRESIAEQCGEAIADIIFELPRVKDKSEEGEVSIKYRDQIKKAALQLSKLQLEGKTPTQLQEAAKTMIGRQLDLGRNSDVADLLQKFWDRGQDNRDKVIQQIGTGPTLKRASSDLPLRKSKFGTLRRRQSQAITWAERLGGSPSISKFGDRIANLDKTRTQATTKQLQEYLRNIDAMINNNLVDPRDRQDLKAIKDVLAHKLETVIINGLKSQMKEKLSRLEEGGGSQTFTVSIEVGVGTYGLNASVGGEMEFTVTGGDDTHLREGTRFSMSIGTRAGVPDVVSTESKAAGGVKKGKIYAGLEHFIDNNADGLILTFLSKNSSGFALKSRAKKEAKLESAAVTGQAELLDSLIRKGVIGTGDTLKGVQRKETARPMKTTTGVLSAKAGVSLGPGLVGISGKVGTAITRFTTRLNLLPFLNDRFSTIKEDEALEAFYAKNHNIVRTTDKSYDTIEQHYQGYLDIAREIRKQPEMSTQHLRFDREKIEKDIELLHREFDAYQKVVCKHDKDPSNRDLAKRKHEMEQLRGVKNRAEFLKSVILTHAKLKQSRHLLSSIAGFNDDFTESITRFERLYSMPLFKLPESQRKILTVPQTLKGSQTDVAIGITLLGQSITVKASQIPTHANPDNEGTYLNVKFPVLALEAISKGSDVFAKSLVESGLVSADAVEEVVAQMQNAFSTITADIATSLGFPVGLGLPVGINWGSTSNIEFNFIKNHDGTLSLQYSRTTLSNKLGAHATGIPVGPTPVVVGGAAAYESTTNVGERIGTNTLTYVRAKYHGWSSSGNIRGENSKWNRWIARNQDSFKDLFIKMGKDGPASIPGQQLYDILYKDLKQPRPLTGKLLDSITKFSENPDDPALFDAAMTNFVEALELHYNQVYTPEAAKRFKTKL